VYDEDDSDQDTAQVRTALAPSSKSARHKSKSKPSKTKPKSPTPELDVSNVSEVPTRFSGEGESGSGSSAPRVADTEVGVEGEAAVDDEHDEEMEYAATVRAEEERVKEQKLKHAKLLYDAYVVPLNASRVLSADEAAKMALMAHMQAGRVRLAPLPVWFCVGSLSACLSFHTQTHRLK
jgi:hypothetical protein